MATRIGESGSEGSCLEAAGRAADAVSRKFVRAAKDPCWNGEEQNVSDFDWTRLDSAPFMGQVAIIIPARLENFLLNGQTWPCSKYVWRYSVSNLA